MNNNFVSSQQSQGPRRPPGQGTSRSARRRRNLRRRSQASRGTGPQQQNQNSKRPSMRSQRSRGSYVDNIPRARMPIPSNVSYGDQKTFYRQAGAPKHKEWGQGVRFVGSSLLGSLFMDNNQSDTARCFTPYFAQYSYTPLVGTTYYDLYACQPNQLFKVFALHPAFIPRLNKECMNWGRYAIRSLRIYSQPVANTTEPAGYVACLAHDTAWPLNLDQTAAFDTNDIAQVGTHASGAFFNQFRLKSSDYQGDRTWSTTIPSVFVPAGASSPPSSFIEPYVDTSYQYVWAIARPEYAGGETDGFRGFVYVSYEVDFYSVKSDDSYNMTAMTYNNGAVLNSRKLLQSLPKSECKTRRSTTEKKDVPDNRLDESDEPVYDTMPDFKRSEPMDIDVDMAPRIKSPVIPSMSAVQRTGSKGLRGFMGLGVASS